MTPEEIAQIEKIRPGFSQLTPAQQQNEAMRLKYTSTPQQKQPSLAQSIVPFGVAVGANQAISRAPGLFSSGAAASSSAPVGVGTAVNGGTMMSNGTTLPASIAPPTVPTAGLGPLGTALSAAAVLHGGSGLWHNWGTGGSKGAKKGAMSGLEAGAGAGALVGSAVPVIGTGIGAAAGGAIGALTGGALGLIKTGKHKDQLGRDTYRDTLREAGIYDPNYHLTLTDGTKVNMGLDGSVKNYNVDFNEPGIGNIVALTNPFAYLVTQGDTKKASDLAGELTNAIKGSKDPAAEMRNIFNQAQITQEQAMSGIDTLKVDDQTKAVFKNTINQLGLKSGAQSSGGGGGINLSGLRGFSIKPAKPVSNVPAVRMGLLQSMLGDTLKPIQHPSQTQQKVAAGPQINTTLSKIIG